MPKLLNAILAFIEGLKRKFTERYFKSFTDNVFFVLMNRVHSLPFSLAARLGILSGTNSIQTQSTDRKTIQPAIACTDQGSPLVPATSICQELVSKSDGSHPTTLLISENTSDSQLKSSCDNYSLPEIKSLLMMPISRQHKDILDSFDGCSDGFCIWNLQTNQAYCSPRWYVTLGCRSCSRANNTEWMMTLQQHLDGILECVDCEYQFRHEDGNHRWLRIRGVSCNLSRNLSGILFMITDITRYKHDLDKLTREAYYDDLTQLGNCKALREQLEHMQKHAQRKRDSFAVLFLDLNDFKPINDTRGHRAGDIVLQQCAKRIEEAVRPGDLAFRKGGDEFVVILKEVSVHEEVNPVIERIKEAIKQPIAIETGDPVRTSVSVGCHIVDGSEQTDIEDIIEKADKAMYDAKQSSKYEQMNIVDLLNRTTNDCMHEIRRI